MLNRLQGERPFILINEDTYAEEPSGYATVKPDNYKIGQMLAERLIQDDEEQLENKKSVSFLERQRQRKVWTELQG